MIPLAIFSDPVCPWCFIGKANLDRALQDQIENPFAIQWHPFQLNPDLPAGGVDKTEYLTARFGGADKLVAIHARLRASAEAAGVELDPDIPKRIPNTLDAHRVIHWAGLEGRQTALVSALFRSYWHEGRDIGEKAVLADIAGEVGMDRALALRLLIGPADADDIAARAADARYKGVSAVPTFLIAGQHVVSGAQPPEVWARVISELVQTSKAD